jgi:hypothetical protein
VTSRHPARKTYRTRLRWPRLAGLLGVLAALTIGLGDALPASSGSTASSTPTIAPPIAVKEPDRPAPRRESRALGEADGALPRGTTVFDDAVAGVANLDPALLGALRRASADAGIRFVVDSGWRSPEYQEHLLREAVSKYGSREAAARWVATPETSAHVSGDAVDLGSEAAAWLSEYGAAYGLCRTYGNEWWHFELRPDAVDRGCPPMYADPTHDPRMQQ